MENKYEIISKFKYDNKSYLIIYEKEKRNIEFACIDELGNVCKLDESEKKNVMEVLSYLIINKDNSEYLMEDIVNGNIYKIYLNKGNNVFFWESINGDEEREEDNYILNFRYNHQPTVLYTSINAQNFEKGKYYNRFARIKNKLVPILMSATMSLSFISGCTVQGNDMQNSIQNIETETTQTETTQPTTSEYDMLKEMKEYSWEKVQEIISQNENLSPEEKDFLYKFKFLFEEEHEYMNIQAIYERLKDLKFEYNINEPDINIVQQEGVAAAYFPLDQKIVFYKSKSWDDVSYSIAIHEFLHVLQSNGSFLVEITAEGKTRELRERMIKEGLIKEGDLLAKGYLKEKIENEYRTFLNDPDFNLKYNSNILFQDKCLGYNQSIWIYYALQNLVSKEMLDRAFYGPTYVYGLEKYTDNKEELHELFFKDMVELRSQDYKIEHKVYNHLNKYYKKKFGKDMVEDFDLYCKSYPNTIFTTNTFPFMEEEYGNKGPIFAPVNAIKDTFREKIRGEGACSPLGEEFSIQEDNDGTVKVISLISYEGDGVFEEFELNKDLANKYVKYLEEQTEINKEIIKNGNILYANNKNENEER